ncbi:DUF3034 family protein [Dokdonella sp.]|jgi:hypothetical protein|uniref:DUF3034 family protein n=1 Tax=Dokdonella sp. TaxID=2291710 RepID=UPI002C74C314|nr:DUF3034 family protein [Dokdonella sp.]HNV09509.1 DUF3034 family protein [Dokdonella sp.]HPW04630.1 DUF3034 family protein [Dokdonella sp.]HQX34354.1 DUF3034 family protein [Dokdonella sp.]
MKATTVPLQRLASFPRVRIQLRHATALLCLTLFISICGSASAASDGRLLATGGATQIEGSAGGGLVPWAVLTGYATRDEIGVTAFATHVEVEDFGLDSLGAAINLRNRVELSASQQRLDLGPVADELGMPGYSLRQNVFGIKVRLAGDVIYTPWPQLALGAQYKDSLDGAIPLALGARDDHGTDVYLSATKLFLGAAGGRNLLLNGTLRSTSANQLGLLGFGGSGEGRSLQAEVSAAILFTPSFAAGIEYRQKPDNLDIASEDDFRDLFIAWFPNKHVSTVLAWVDLGSIANHDRQRGWYLSVQVSP